METTLEEGRKVPDKVWANAMIPRCPTYPYGLLCSACNRPPQFEVGSENWR